MSKAIQGAAEIAAGVVLEFVPGGQVFGSMLIAAGIATEIGALASALGHQGGVGVTTRQAAGLRQIIRGTQRVGGTIVYCSTTGSTHRQYNMVIVLATHQVDAITDLYLDGRKVYWNTSSWGNQTRNGANFGGDANGSEYIGPNGAHYNFGGKVFCRAYYGDQNATTGFSTDLQANDPTWSPTTQGTPYLGGCAYVYLKVVYDTAVFPQLPEIKFTVRGKNDIYDPRTGTTGYTDNWALHVADAIADTKWGVGDGPVSSWGPEETAQLIAAANVCDEPVALAAGGTEKRYCLHCHYDTGMGPGEVVSRMMDVAAGRLVEVGGLKRFIYPAYWQGPSLSFNADDLAGVVQWNSTRSLSELVNRVSGKYTAANYPWNVAGNLYDSHGYWDGTMENTFPFAFQPSDFPMYACDQLHGYGTGVDVYLTQDGGIRLPLDLDLTWCLSITQAQRVAKIRMLRNRQQGSGELPMKITALQAVCTDVIQFTFDRLGWTNKVLEIDGDKAITIRCAKDDNGVPCFTMNVKVHETDPSVYAWSTTEELTPYDVPAITGGVSVFSVAAPTAVVALSNFSTAVVQPDGSVTPRIELTWAEPADTYVTNGGSIEIQACAHGSAAWQDVFVVSGQTTIAYIAGVVMGQNYDLRLRSIRSGGAPSDWVEIDGITVAVTPGGGANLTQPIAQDALLAQALTDGTANIIVNPFTAIVGNASVACLTAGAYTLTGRNQAQQYFVYYIDPGFAGGAITPIATQNSADFSGKPGYYYIGSIVTPRVTSGGGGVGVYRPGSYFDSGDLTTQSPDYGIDANPTTAAVLRGFSTQHGADCSFASFPTVTLAAAATLTVVLSLDISGTVTNDSTVMVSVAGTNTTLFSAHVTTATVSRTMTLPSGTNLAQVSVNAAAGLPSPLGGNVLLKIFDINIQ